MPATPVQRFWLTTAEVPAETRTCERQVSFAGRTRLAGCLLALIAFGCGGRSSVPERESSPSPASATIPSGEGSPDRLPDRPAPAADTSKPTKAGESLNAGVKFQGQASAETVTGFADADEEKKISDLTAALNDSDSAVRAAAAKALGELGAKAKTAVPALTTVTKDNSTDTRRAAITALGMIGGKDGLGTLIALTKSIRQQRVAPDMAVLATALAGVGKDAVPELRLLLKEDEVRIRLVAVNAMALIGKDALDGLGDALNDKDAKNRLAAVQGLGRVGKDAAELLIRALADDSRAVQEAASQRLGKMVKDAKTPLIAALKSESLVIRSRSAGLLGELGLDGADAVKPLIENLTHENLDVRYSAVFALGKIGPKAADAVKPLCEAMKDKNSHVQRQVIWSLGEIAPRSKNTVAAMIGAVSDPDVNVRTGAVRALGKAGADGGEAVGPLLELLRAERPTVSSSTVLDALKGIGPENASVETKTLVEALAVKNADVRVFAAKALTAKGAEAKSAVPALLPLVKDSDRQVRDAAYTALEKIDPATAKQVGKP